MTPMLLRVNDDVAIPEQSSPSLLLHIGRIIAQQLTRDRFRPQER
jgi:hypothetical protein